MSETLEEIESARWHAAPSDSSGMVLRCHALRKIPLSQFSADDYRVMIGQGIGLKYLVPKALEFLEVDPLMEGDCFCGDLLSAILSIPEQFWVTDRESLDKMPVIAQCARQKLLAAELRDENAEHLLADIEALLANRA